MDELIIGSHVSFNKDTQLLGSVLEALSYRANTFMFYTGAPQNTRRAKINDEKTREAYAKMEEYHMNPANIIVHAPYIINLANNVKVDNHRFAIEFLGAEIERCEQLGIPRLVLHPGSHVSLTREQGLKNIIDGLNSVIERDQGVFICLETMAGKGTELGTLDDIAYIMKHMKYPEKIMVCLDTCHLNDAGYDMADFDSFLQEFDEKIGISKIGCIHINDTKNELGSHKDRHENFGYGYIGFDNLIKIVYHESLKNVPKILETPYVSKTDDDSVRSYPPYHFEIEMIREKKFNSKLIEDIRQYYR